MSNKYDLPLVDLLGLFGSEVFRANRSELVSAVLVAARLARTRMNDADYKTWLAEVISELQGSL